MRSVGWRTGFLRWVLVLLLVGALAPLAAAAKWKPVTPQTKLKLGQDVQVNWHGEWIDGKIVEFRQVFDQVLVRFRTTGFASHELTWPFKRSALRVRATTPRSSRGSSRGDPFAVGSDNPFEPDKGFRTWQDDTGQFKIEAELVKVEDDAVRLKRRDGQMVTVPLDRLCEEDQQFVRRLQGSGEDENDEDEDSSNGENEGDKDASFVDQLPTKRAKSDSGEGVYLSTVDPSGINPDGGTVPVTLVRRSIALPPQEDFFERPLDVCVAATEPGQVMLPFARLNQHNQPTRIVLCDLASRGSRPRALTFPVDAVAVDLSPDGKSVLSCPNGFGFGAKSRVDLWNIQNGKLEHALGWKPYVGAGHMGRDGDVKWAAFVDENHVLTCGDQEKVILWKLPEVEAVYSLSVAWGTEPALSAGRKQLAVLTDLGLMILDAKTGEVLGSYEGAGSGGTIAFRPDGGGIALATSTRLIVWELTQAKPYRDIGLGVTGVPSERMAWPAKNYILLGGRYLVDLEKYCLLWDYQGGQFANSIGRQLWCLCCQHNSVTLVPQPIPHEAALEAARRLKPEEYRGIEPGATVSLEVNVSASGDRLGHIRQMYEQQLESRGLKVAPGQQMKLVLSTKPGKSEKVLYVESRGFRHLRPFGSLSSDDRFETVMFQQQVSEVAFVIDGKSAWQTSCTVTAPTNVQLEDGESIVQAVKKHEVPNIDFFNGVAIPSYIARPHDSVTFGASKLTPNGLAPATVQSRSSQDQQGTDPLVSPTGDLRT